MKRLILIFSIALFVFSCKSEKKEPIDNQESEKKEIKLSFIDQIEKNYGFNKVENLLEKPNLVNLSSEVHSFTEEIVFEEVNAIKTAEDTYSILLVLSEKETDFDEFIKWTVAIIVTPKDPSKFEKESERKKGARTIGIYGKPQIMGDEVVIHLKNFKLKPKEYSFIRFYLYNTSNNQEKNTNYLVIKDVTLP